MFVTAFRMRASNISFQRTGACAPAAELGSFARRGSLDRAAVLIGLVASLVGCSSLQPCKSREPEILQPHFDVPQAFWDHHSGGTVGLRARVGTDGCVKGIDVVSSPGPDYSEEAKRNVTRWIYRPLSCGGVPVESISPITFNFTHKRDGE